MKKLAVVSAVLAALTASSAFANITVDVYGTRTTSTDSTDGAKSGLFGQSTGKQGVEIGYSPIENLGLTAEFTTAKDMDLGAAWTFDLSENIYLKPSVGYVAKFDKEDNVSYTHDELGLDNTYDSIHLDNVDSNIAKAGLEAGAAFGDFFTSVRYRVEVNTKATELYVKKGDVTDSLWKNRGKIGRTDLLIGYNLDGVTLTGKAIHRSQLDNQIREVNGLIGQDNAFWTSELKATLTSYEGVAPYIQYAHDHSNHNNEIKLGAKFSF